MKILLVCNEGMSTSIMRVKLEQEAAAIGQEATIVAVPLVELGEHVDGTDVVLLGPQVRYAMDEARQALPPSIPVLAISPQDFGTMNAKKVMAQAVEAMNA